MTTAYDVLTVAYRVSRNCGGGPVGGVLSQDQLGLVKHATFDEFTKCFTSG